MEKNLFDTLRFCYNIPNKVVGFWVFEWLSLILTFDNRIHFHHLNTTLVLNLDPNCINTLSFQTCSHNIRSRSDDNFKSIERRRWWWWWHSSDVTKVRSGSKERNDKKANGDKTRAHADIVDKTGADADASEKTCTRHTNDSHRQKVGTASCQEPSCCQNSSSSSCNSSR